MNALALLNNFEREFARPIFHRPLSHIWLRDWSDKWPTENAETKNASFNYEMNYDKENSNWNLTLELAGVTKNNVKVDTHDGHLKITGEKTKGFNKGAFDLSFALPEGVDVEKIEANFEDSILILTLPLEAKKATKKIEIK